MPSERRTSKPGLVAWTGLILGAVGTLSGVFAFLHTRSEARLRRDLDRQALLDDARDHLSGRAGEAVLQTFSRDPKQIELARRKIERARRLDPEDPDVYICEGLYHEARGELIAGENAYRQALELADRPHAAAYANLGFVLAKQGRFEESEQTLTNAASQEASSAAVQTTLCFVLHLQERLDEAADACTRAIELDSRYLPGHINLGNVLLAQGHFQAAIQRFETALEIDPNSAAILANLGLARRYVGDEEEAFEALRRALELDPTSGLVRSELAVLYRSQGEELRAEIIEASAEALVVRQPSNDG